SWFTPAHIEEEERPSELPSYFRLIEARVGEHPYPLTTVDDYGWTWYFPSFLDHLAVVIAHELYHYTQPSFAQYRSNNEWEANLSALQQVQRLGFRVQAAAPARREACHG